MIVYDVETFPNVFTLSARGANTDDGATWEISKRRNDTESLVSWLHTLATNKIEMVGFNNLDFDYPIIHLLLSNPNGATADALYQKAMQIIQGDRFAHMVWPSDRWIPQIDLFKIHHFDNVARSTSLKSLQFNMRSASVEDLPFAPGTILTPEQIDVVRGYNMHDVDETKAFLLRSLEQIAFRREISEQYQRDFMNHNDTKIGKDYFVMRLEEARPGSCFTNTKPRKPVQTYRSSIPLRDVVLPYIEFDHPEFQRIHQWFLSETIYNTKGAITDVSCTVDGFTFHFGTGGIHGSVAWQHPRETATHSVIDLDVTSFYPSIAITNRLYPEHLGELFCDIYADVKQQRTQHKKGTAINAMLKLSLNGVYGDSNNPYSPFFDSKYTMAITVNGQLLLCMLAERLMMTVPDLEMIQINTDGLTVKVPREYEWIVEECGQWWQRKTGLELEAARYKHMFIRDVNNYLAVDERDKVKRKGAYENQPPDKRNPVGWHQDLSAMVVQKVVEQVIVKGADAETTLRAHTDPFDFMLRAKVPRNSKLMHGDTQVQGTTRYYVALNGAPLVKVSPPPAGEHMGWYKRGRDTSRGDYLAWHATHGNVWNTEIHTGNKSVWTERHLSIQKGWDAAICNRASDFEWKNVNYNWYLAAINKLLTP